MKPESGECITPLERWSHDDAWIALILRICAEKPLSRTKEADHGCPIA
jgi:hypothetical protein